MSGRREALTVGLVVFLAVVSTVLVPQVEQGALVVVELVRGAALGIWDVLVDLAP